MLMTWEAFLTAMRVNQVRYEIDASVGYDDLGITYEQLTPTTLFYAPFCPVHLLYLYPEKRDPAFHVGVHELEDIVENAGLILPWNRQPTLSEDFLARHDWEFLPFLSGRQKVVELLGVHFVYQRRQLDKQ